MQIGFVESEAEIALCLDLRRKVFMDEQGVSEEEEIDGLDPVCRHVLAVDDGRAVAAARVKTSGDLAKIQRVCVATAYRGQGLGAQLIRYIVDALTGEASLAVVRLGAQTQALGFYERLGFTPVGGRYLDAGIPHQDMELRLADRR
ncbi:GNAT family N-acetyltransferase [Pelagibius sp.]|uniref:GNAT family N-acetyltransferase n=1 Tax=Pelagibius sp. TaxID=1931238 RepID=UPI0026224CBD|nr:GNAT family N-acetyltransferase [Pelagibius sp.]